jgi:hypothetical protein|tara:strand:- start:40 stop:228 length:189 start_codon:yes stop_codon:yes gene_type:complete
MTLRLDEGFDDDELPERYVAALLVIADFHDISVNEAHSGITEMLEELEVDVQLESNRSKTKH